MLKRNRLPSSAGRSVVLALATLLVVTIAEPPIAFAGSLAPTSGVTVARASSDATDFSSARRRRRYSRRGSDAAGLAFMGMAIGTIGAIAAQQRRDDYYYNNGYGYGPGYYGGGPSYYGGGPYYGRRYYRRY